MWKGDVLHGDRQGRRPVELPAGVGKKDIEEDKQMRAHNKGIKGMMPEQLKRENSRLYNEVLEAAREEGKANGIKKERQRILSLLTWTSGGGQNRHMDRIIASAVKEAIVSGADDTAVIASVKVERERVSALQKWTEKDAGKNEAINSIVAEAISSGKMEKEVLAKLTAAFFKFSPGGSGKADSETKKYLNSIAKYLAHATDREQEAILTPADHARIERILDKLDPKMGNRFLMGKDDPECGALLTAADRTEVRRVLAKWDDAQWNKIIGQHGKEDYRHVFEE